jgi:hypothetical protein
MIRSHFPAIQKGDFVVRTKIIQYTSSEGTRIVAAKWKQRHQCSFVRLWRSAAAPATGQTIGITLRTRLAASFSRIHRYAHY